MKHRSVALSTAATATAAINAICINICQNNDDVNGRVGQKIKLWRVDIRGVVDPAQDVYLLQAHTADAPVYADFYGAGAGSFLNDTKVNTQFTEWHYVRPVPHQTTNCPFRITKKFRGMEVAFDGTNSTPVRNALYLVVKNDSGSSLNYSYSYTIWYTDN